LILGFAFTYAVIPMIDGMGLQGAFLLLAFIGMAFWAGCFIMIMVGKKTRKWTASAYWKMIEQHGLRSH
jgi:apolipoprotein N-acyltransferase